MLQLRLCFCPQGFRTRDGHIVVAAGNDRQFVQMCQVSPGPPGAGLELQNSDRLKGFLLGLQVLDLMEVSEEPKYRTNKLRVQNRRELLDILSQRYQNHHKSEP